MSGFFHEFSSHILVPNTNWLGFHKSFSSAMPSFPFKEGLSQFSNFDNQIDLANYHSTWSRCHSSGEYLWQRSSSILALFHSSGGNWEGRRLTVWRSFSRFRLFGGEVLDLVSDFSLSGFSEGVRVRAVILFFIFVLIRLNDSEQFL